jgi:hypothetical protein
MKRFVQEQLGKFLLGVALIWVGAAYTFFPSRPTVFPDEAQFADYQKRVRVEYAPGELAPDEIFFPVLQADEYTHEDLEKWVRKRAPEVIFTGVELPEVTGARIQPAPQLLPDPGPSLKGADQLKRWGEELPPLKVPASADTKGKTGVKGRL